MKKILAAVLGMAFMATAAAGDLAGNYTWEGFTIAVTKGGDNGYSAKVTAGPKNVGMEMIQTPMKEEGGAMMAKIKHPMTGDVYNAKMTPDGNDFKMDGCTDAGACASGKFVRQ